MDETNKDFAAKLLFVDPETGQELRPETTPHDQAGALVIVVRNKDGSRRWRHTLRTEEV